MSWPSCYAASSGNSVAHFVRDFDGEVGPADEVERRLARMRRDFGVDVVVPG